MAALAPGQAGCPYVGSIHFSAANGDVEYTWDMDEYRLDVKVSGLAKGSLVYSVDADGNALVKGTYGGQAFDIVE